MANDLTALIADIQGDLPRADITNANFTTDIVSSVRQYEASRFFFNEQSLGPVTISATNTYAFSLWAPATNASTASDIIEIDAIRVNLTNRAYVLEEVSYAQLNQVDEQSNSTPGYPQIYAVYNRAIRIYPMPSATGVMTATISAHVKFPDLATGTDANVWTNEGKDLIRNAALKRLWSRRLQDMTKAAFFAQMESDALMALQRRTSALAGNRIRSVL